MSTLESAAETALSVGRGAMVMNHIRNNRIEYLVLMLFSHMLGLTDKIVSNASGVCG